MEYVRRRFDEKNEFQDEFHRYCFFKDNPIALSVIF